MTARIRGRGDERATWVSAAHGVGKNLAGPSSGRKQAGQARLDTRLLRRAGSRS